MSNYSKGFITSLLLCIIICSILFATVLNDRLNVKVREGKFTLSGESVDLKHIKFGNNYFVSLAEIREYISLGENQFARNIISLNEKHLEDRIKALKDNLVNPEVVDKGFTVSSYFANGEFYLASYGIAIRNPNDTTLIDPRVIISFYDDKGNLLKVETETFGVMKAYEIAYVGDIARIEQVKPYRIEVSTVLNFVDPLKGDIKDFLFRDLSYRSINDRFDGGSIITGYVFNPYKENLMGAKINLVYFDSNGNIIGGGYTFAHLLAEEYTPISYYGVGGLNVKEIKAYVTIPPYFDYLAK